MSLQEKLATPPSKARATIYVLLSAISFSLAGLLIKLVPWSAMAINGFRCLLAILVIGLYMRAQGHRLHINKMVVLGALAGFVMMLTFVIANQLTTAANAIVLQFTEPVFVILFTAIMFKSRPTKGAVITCVVVMIGIVLFFFDKLGHGSFLGDALAILSGAAYAMMFMLKRIPGGDYEMSSLLAMAIGAVTGLPFVFQETIFSPAVIWAMVIMGLVQTGLSFVLLGRGLDGVSPVTASLTSTIEPVLSPLLVAIFLSEMIGPLSLLGAVLVVGASTVYNVLSARKTPKPTTTD